MTRDWSFPMRHPAIARRASLAGVCATLVSVVTLVTAVACTDLTVPNDNNPDRIRATSTPGDVENLIASTFQRWWPRVYGTTPTIMWSQLAYEFSSPFVCLGSQYNAVEPRPAWNNTTVYSNSGVSSNTWIDLYGTISLANDGLKALNGGLLIGTNGANNSRARAFAKFMQGVAHGYLALMYDKAAILDETTNLDTLITPIYSPYTDVMTAAIAMLKTSIAISDTATFTIPPVGWVPGLTLTNKDLARLGHTYIARFMAYVPRSATERAAVNWNEVITQSDAGITADFAPIGTPGVFEDLYKQRAARLRTVIPSDFMRGNGWLIGPSDSTDAFKTWVATPVGTRTAFQVRTKDRRIQGPTGVGSKGKYFGYDANISFYSAARGLYNASYYAFYHYGTGTSYQSGPLVALTRTELDLLKAEALIRLNRAAEALPLINKTRVPNGELPAVDINGPPDQPGCVPRKPTGGCGSLWDALKYEKRIEEAGVDGQVAMWDARGWGTLAQNTFLNLPIPGRELEVVRMPNYTNGGGGTFSAPAPDFEKCPVSLPRCP
jgi:hypothetical protein